MSLKEHDGNIQLTTLWWKRKKPSFDPTCKQHTCFMTWHRKHWTDPDGKRVARTREAHRNAHKPCTWHNTFMGGRSAPEHATMTTRQVTHLVKVWGSAVDRRYGHSAGCSHGGHLHFLLQGWWGTHKREHRQNTEAHITRTQQLISCEEEEEEESDMQQQEAAFCKDIRGRPFEQSLRMNRAPDSSTMEPSSTNPRFSWFTWSYLGPKMGKHGSWEAVYQDHWHTKIGLNFPIWLEYHVVSSTFTRIINRWVYKIASGSPTMEIILSWGLETEAVASMAEINNPCQCQQWHEIQVCVLITWIHGKVLVFKPHGNVLVFGPYMR